MRSSSRWTFVAFGGGATAAGLLFLFRSKKQKPREIASQANPTLRAPRSTRGLAPLVAFTTLTIPYRNRKTGKEGTYGQVSESIPDLTERASAKLGRPIDQSTFILATMIGSEAGGQHKLAKVAVAHAARNMANRKELSIFELLTPSGAFGSQGFGGRAYAATSRPPTAEDVEVAEAVLGNEIGDPTGGATQWDSPNARAHYTSSPEQVEADRIREGKEKVLLPGISEGVFRFWRPVPKARRVAPAA